MHTITDPITTERGIRASGLRLGQQRSHALLAALQIFRLQPHGFRNTDLRTLVAQLRGLTGEQFTAGQMTYDPRRLRVHGLIERIPHSHRYRVTHERLLPTGLAQISDPTASGRLRAAAHAYQTAIDNLTDESELAA